MTEQEVKNAIKYVLEGYYSSDSDAETETMIYNILTALELQIPTSPDVTNFTKRCPNCKRQLSASNNSKSMYKHCPRCGQKIKWNEHDED
jgi:rRNA maturation endonuclease Nob1